MSVAKFFSTIKLYMYNPHRIQVDSKVGIISTSTYNMIKKENPMPKCFDCRIMISYKYTQFEVR